MQAAAISTVYLAVGAFGLASCGDDTSTTPGETVEVCPLTDCSGACVDTTNDPDNCGGCGTACATDEYCSSGTCTAAGTDACATGQTECGGLCASTDTDRNNCGACGTVCTDGEVCDGAGVCALSCQSGLIDCNGTCVDPNTDEAFCGASGDCQGGNAGTACAAGETCDGAGTCALSCQSGLIDCNGTCIDPNVNTAFCGATGDCAGGNAGTACGAGEKCNGAGVCALSCQTGYSLCGGNCVDDNLGMVECNNACIDPATDEGFCGASGTCMGNDAGTACTNAQTCLNSTCITTDTTIGYTGVLDSYTVPSGVTLIEIEALGAKGGGPAGGSGAAITGTFGVTPGQVLTLLVGGQGLTTGTTAGSGGGGTFVTTVNDLPLLIAGGGGGVNNGQSVPGFDGLAGPDGGAAGDGTPGGVDGAGGSFGGASSCGCGGPGSGGGGFFGNGLNSNDGGGLSFVNGGTGGADWSGNCITANLGGFGGGGSSGNAGGGGGGYSGGAGGANTCTQSDRSGGGGGSFNTGTNQTNTSGVNSGNGQIVIRIVG
jgi:hypothetical protein